VLQNTLGFAVVWTRYGVGGYLADFSANPLNINKLYVLNANIGSVFNVGNTLYEYNGTPVGQYMFYFELPVNGFTPAIALDVYDSADNQVEMHTMTQYIPIEIRVYN
jgi:hypothetical protein